MPYRTQSWTPRAVAVKAAGRQLAAPEMELHIRHALAWKIALQHHGEQAAREAGCRVASVQSWARIVDDPSDTELRRESPTEKLERIIGSLSRNGDPVAALAPVVEMLRALGYAPPEPLEVEEVDPLTAASRMLRETADVTRQAAKAINGSVNVEECRRDCREAIEAILEFQHAAEAQGQAVTP